MRIAILRREFITHLDGVNRFIANLADGFKELGHDVVILSWSLRGVDTHDLPKWFKEIHGLDYEHEIYTLRGPESADKWVTMMYEWYTIGSRMLKRLGLDVAVVNGVVPIKFRPKVAVLHGPLKFRPKVAVSRKDYETVPLPYKFVLKALYAMYDERVCVSEESAREYRGIAKCNRVIPLPLKLKNFTPVPLSSRADYLVHIGTRPVKNPDVSVKAVEILRREGYNVKLVIIGGKNKEVETLCRELEFCVLEFDVSEKQKNEILCRARALLLPSSAETFSLTAIEAMVCGTPPIVSSAVPHSVVIHGFNGIRVESLDPQRYAEAIKALLSDEDMWKEIHSSAIQFVKQFDYLNIAREYIRTLEKLMETG